MAFLFGKQTPIQELIKADHDKVCRVVYRSRTPSQGAEKETESALEMPLDLFKIHLQRTRRRRTPPRAGALALRHSPPPLRALPASLSRGHTTFAPHLQPLTPKSLARPVTSTGSTRCVWQREGGRGAAAEGDETPTALLRAQRLGSASALLPLHRNHPNPTITATLL